MSGDTIKHESNYNEGRAHLTLKLETWRHDHPKNRDIRTTPESGPESSQPLQLYDFVMFIAIAVLANFTLHTMTRTERPILRPQVLMTSANASVTGVSTMAH